MGNTKALTPEEQKAAKARILSFMEKGMGVKAAAGAASVSYQSLYNWQKSDPEFKEATEQANSKAVAIYVDALMKAAQDGNATATTFFLQRRGSEDWREGMDAKQLEAITKLLAIL